MTSGKCAIKNESRRETGREYAAHTRRRWKIEKRMRVSPGRLESDVDMPRSRFIRI